MKAKKLLSLLLALSMVFALAACSSNNEPKASEEPEAREEVVVFAAASMTETLNQIKRDLREGSQRYPDLQLRLVRHPQDSDPGRRRLRPVHFRRPEADEPA